MNVADLERNAEITKLAGLLAVDEDELQFLREVSPAAIREFRYQISDRLFASDGDKLRRIAAASKLVPAAIAAKAAAHAFGPLLCASIAGSVEPSRAVAIANNLPVKFLAAATTEIDPRRTKAVLSEVPPALGAKVAAYLVSRGEHITMGRFVGVVGDEATRAAAAEVADADLLQVSFLLEDRSAIDRVIGLVADRLPGVLRAADTEDLWGYAFGMLDAINDEHKALVGNLSVDLEPDALGRMINAAHDTQAWQVLLPVTRLMDRDRLATFSTNTAVHQPEVLADILETALVQGLWLDLLPMAARLPDEPRAHLASLVAALDADKLADLIGESDAAGQWESMLPIATMMTSEDQARLAALPVMADVDVLANVLSTIGEGDMWSAALPLVNALPEDVKPTLAETLDVLSDAHVESAARSAADNEIAGPLISVLLLAADDERQRVLSVLARMADVDTIVKSLGSDDDVWGRIIEHSDELPESLAATLRTRSTELGIDEW